MNARTRPSIAAIYSIAAIVAITLVSLLAFGSCATTRKSVARFAPLTARDGPYKLGSIELESVYSYSDSLGEIRAVILSRAAREGLPLEDGQAEEGGETESAARERPSISFFLRERQYAKGLKIRYSLAVLAEVRDPSGNAVLRANFFRDGDDSFDSFAVLDRSLGAIIREVSLALRKAK